MAFLFNRGRSRQPMEVVRTIKDALLRLREAPNTPKVGLNGSDRVPWWLRWQGC